MITDKKRGMERSAFDDEKPKPRVPGLALGGLMKKGGNDGISNMEND
jgi:hypothetical protein